MGDDFSDNIELLDVSAREASIGQPYRLKSINTDTNFVGVSPRVGSGVKPIALKYFIAAAAFGLAMDQNLIAPNMSAIADEFNMSNNERDKKIGGGLAFAFFLLGAPAAIGIGFAADHCNRRDLLAFTTLLGGISTLGSGLSYNYASLFWTRALAGAAVGGMMPLNMSLLADLYSPKKRTVMISYLATISGIGVGSGQNVGGVIGPLFGWRYAFILVSLPAFMVAVGIYYFTLEPIRGALDINTEEDDDEKEEEKEDEDDDDDEEENNRNTAVSKVSIVDTVYVVSQTETSNNNKSSLRKLKALFMSQCTVVSYVLSTPSVALACAQGAVGCVPWGVVATFLNDYLAQDRKLGVLASTLIQTMLGIGGLIGTVVGGYFGQKFYNKRPYQMSLFMGIAAIIGAIPFVILINLPTGSNYGISNQKSLTDNDENESDVSISLNDDVESSSGVLGGGASWQLLGVYMFFSFITGIGICMTGNCVASMVQNTVLPESRGAAFAIFNLSDDVGRGLGPLAVAGLVIGFDGHRRKAFSVAAIGWILCGIFNCISAITIEKDIELVRKHLLENKKLTASSSKKGVEKKREKSISTINSRVDLDGKDGGIGLSGARRRQDENRPSPFFDRSRQTLSDYRNYSKVNPMHIFPKSQIEASYNRVQHVADDDWFPPD